MARTAKWETPALSIGRTLEISHGVLAPLDCISWLAGCFGALKTRQRKGADKIIKVFGCNIFKRPHSEGSQ
jgi:hypothetical protein